MRNTGAGGGGGGTGTASKTSNFAKMVSGRASTRHGGGGGGGKGGGRGDDRDRSSGSGRRSRKKKKDDQARVIVDGRDVTPQPLAFANAAFGQAAAAGAMHASIATQLAGGASADLASLDTGGDSSLSMHGGMGGGMGGMGMGMLTHGGMSTLSVSESEHGYGGGGGGGSGGAGGSNASQYAGGNILDSDRDWAGGLAARLGMQFEYATEGGAGGAAQAPQRAKEWSDKELRAKITIKIEETPTITLLHIPSLRIWGEDEAAAAADARANRAYLACLEKHKEKDKYSARGVQTLNGSRREKEVQVAPPTTRSVAADVSTWDLFDVAQRLEMQMVAAAAAAAPGPGGAAAAAAAVPLIQHESDLVARTAHLKASAAAAAASSAGHAGGGGGGQNAAGSGDRDEDEDGYAASMRNVDGGGRGGGGGGGANGTGSSNTPSVHSAQHSFRNGAGGGAGGGGGNANLSGAGTSFRGGAGGSKNNLSWHQGLSTAGGGGGAGSSMHGAHAASSASTLGPKAGQTGGAGSSVAMAGGRGGPGAGAAAAAAGALSSGFSPLDKLFAKASFGRALRALEQGVLQTSLHPAQMLYRNHPEAPLAADFESAEALSAGGGGGGGSSAAGQGEERQGSSLLPPLSSLAALGSSSAASAADKNAEAAAAAASAAAAAAAAAAHSSPAGVSASLVSLWSFQCGLTAGLNVSCLAWNKQNGDLLAAGYGSVDFGHSSRDAAGNLINGIIVPSLPSSKGGARGRKGGAGGGGAGGLVLFWSLKNPCYPQKVFYTRHSVTSLDFSDEHPHLLAAGLYDGSVAIYDVRDTASKPALESAHQTGKHSEAVWGVKWVSKDLGGGGVGVGGGAGGAGAGAGRRSQQQQLTSISTDGSVKQWSVKKGLVPRELMSLKRVPNRAQLAGSAMEGVSREASGLCFDFPYNDGTQYFAGTEEGLIHKCSVSYNEQTLENFHGHTAAVYAVRCSPFHPDAFLSASADWSAALWSQKQPAKPVLKFSGGHDYIVDIAWSPNCSTMFGLVSREGRVEIWDLAVSPLDPVVKFFVPMPRPPAPTEAQVAAAAAAAQAATTLAHADGSALLDSPKGSSSATASAPVPALPEAPKRFLSCISFSAVAPVVLVGTSDGAILLYRLEGSALTTQPPPAEALLGLDAASAAQQALQSYGQEINAHTVMQVPRDRDRDRDGHNGGSDSVSVGGSVGSLLDGDRSLLQQHQSNLAKFREQAHKLELVMDQHNDSKSQHTHAHARTHAPMHSRTLSRLAAHLFALIECQLDVSSLCFVVLSPLPRLSLFLSFFSLFCQTSSSLPAATHRLSSRWPRRQNNKSTYVMAVNEASCASNRVANLLCVSFLFQIEPKTIFFFFFFVPFTFTIQMKLNDDLCLMLLMLLMLLLS